jgi:hypothetical protein
MSWSNVMDRPFDDIVVPLLRQWKAMSPMCEQYWQHRAHT